MRKICVIGGANIDICGISNMPLKEYDSNPGQIQVCYGGVGRNIAQICAMLGQKTLFVSCFSKDAYGIGMESDCRALNIDTSLSKWVDDIPTSMYIAILDDTHDMRIAMSDMRILEAIDRGQIDCLLKQLDSDDLLMLDANLNDEILEYIVTYTPCKIAADPVSASKVQRLRPFLNRIAIFKPNQYEAKMLNGIEIVDEKTAIESIKWFLEQGVEEIMISMADRGVIFGTKQKITWLTHRPIQLVNATGGGDAFIGSYLVKRLHHSDVYQAIRYAMSAAVAVIEQDALRQKTFTDTLVIRQLEDLKIEERIL